MTCLCDLNYVKMGMIIYICMYYRIVMELASCIPYALGHPRIIGVST